MSREFIALAIMGIDQHENGAIAVARVLREAQMKVEYLGKFHTPDSVADKRSGKAPTCSGSAVIPGSTSAWCRC
jgi:methylmalonyl-CoA mutase cobalamin-binding subunit